MGYACVGLLRLPNRTKLSGRLKSISFMNKSKILTYYLPYGLCGYLVYDIRCHTHTADIRYSVPCSFVTLPDFCIMPGCFYVFSYITYGFISIRLFMVFLCMLLVSLSLIIPIY